MSHESTTSERKFSTIETKEEMKKMYINYRCIFQTVFSTPRQSARV